METLQLRKPARSIQKSFWRHPRPLWARRAMFQIHLWVGLLLCLYALLIGVSGSVLVFEDELTRLNNPEWMQARHSPPEPATGLAFARISHAVEQAFGEWRLDVIYSPGFRGGNYAALISRAGKYSYVYASADDDRLLGPDSLDKGWLNWIADLHFRLLGGPTGLIVNGIGAACLLLLCLSGAVIWWPGVKTWKRALSVDFRRRSKRINFDLHSAVGFWTLGVMALWAVSGVYFVWPEAFVSAVNLVSKTPNASPPKFHLAPYNSSPRLSVQTLVATAVAAEPGNKLQGISFTSGDQPAAVMLAGSDTSNFLHTTWVYLDPVRGTILGFWRNGKRETLGDWFIWLMDPLHFGTYWGLGIKILWATLGVMLPILAITGVLMYWNRYLSKQWRTLRKPVAAA